MRIVRGLRPDQENDFELYSTDSLIAAFAASPTASAGAFIIKAIALRRASASRNIMLVKATERTRGDQRAEGRRGTQEYSSSPSSSSSPR